MTEDEKAQALALVESARAKAIVKEAIKEWLDEQFADFGRYTFMGLVAAAVAGITYLSLAANGWHR